MGECRRRGTRAGVAAVMAAALFLSCAPGTTATAETLHQALTAAYKFNPRLDAERARLRATDEEVPRALSGYRPLIFGSADVGYRKDVTRGGAQGTTTQETNPRGYGVDISQPLFRGFRTLNTVREAEAVVRAQRANLHIIEQSVLLEAVIAYADVVRDQAVVRLRENNVNVLTRELRATEDRFSVGEVTRTDVAQAQARRAGAVSALDFARANLRTARAAFERVVGHPPSNLADPGVPERLLPRTQQEALSIAEQENPNIVAALYREQAARHVVDRIWGELLPEVSVDASYDRRFGLANADEAETTSVTGRLTVPIYQGGEVSARVRQAKHTHVSRLQEVEQFRTEALADVIASWARLEASRALLVSEAAQVEANRVALAGVREEERVGQRTLLDVLNAEQELLNAEVILVTTRRDLAVSAYTLLSSVGRLGAEYLGLGAAVYDPEAHYHEVRRKWWGISITHADGRRERMDLWETHGQHAPAK